MNFCVKAVVVDDLEALKKFVAYYLDQGAARVALYFENPETKLIGEFAHLDKVHCQACTPEFLSGLRRYLDRVGPPLHSVATKAYQDLKEDWLVHLDLDEFMYFPGQKISDVLDKQNESTKVLRPPVVESIASDNESGIHHFRDKMKPETVKEIYGDELVAALEKKNGFIGHSESKIAIRKGLKHVILMSHIVAAMYWPERLLKPFQRINATRRPIPEVLTDDGYVLHFNNEPFETWRRKLFWRMAAGDLNSVLSRGFVKYFFDLADAKKGKSVEQAVEELYSRLFEFDAKRLKKLDKEGVLLSFELNFDALVARYFPSDSDG